jgi:hypothetical protein
MAFYENQTRTSFDIGDGTALALVDRTGVEA